MPFLDSKPYSHLKTHSSQVSTPLLIGIVAVTLVIIVFAAFHIADAAGGDDFALASTRNEEAQASTAASASGALSGAAVGETSSSAKTAFVYVTGCVASPGVYEVAADARVDAAVTLAGGFSEDAAPEAVNLARVVVDGEQINVPSREDVDSGAAAGAPVASGVPGANTGAGGTAASAALVNLNTATQAELESLPGIGPATAQKIIASRTDEGPFTAKEDLKRVSGIGDKKYAAVADLICV